MEGPDYGKSLLCIRAKIHAMCCGFYCRINTICSISYMLHHNVFFASAFYRKKVFISYNKQKGRIGLGLVDNRNTILVTVSDDGPGISSTNLPYIMDPFFTTKKLTANFGLGLTHGYNIMQKHKGFMEIDSTEGKGTMVRLFFPHRVKRV